MNDCCENCASKNVCKYEDSFDRVKKSIENDISPCEEFLYVNIHCRYYTGTKVYGGVERVIYR